MRSNTATATTATADSNAPVGRFAPSPTGPLHQGSLLAAVGSYLQARSQHGRWLVRIEDVDTTRCRPHFENQILRTLDAFGFDWDGPVWRQSARTDAYAAALHQLQQQGSLFRCNCSRREVANANNASSFGCSGRCAERQSQIHSEECSLRWQPAHGRVHDPEATFTDLWQGEQHSSIATPDPILRRRDGLHAYHLAVVVDDAAQGVTQIIRGADLLESTFPQLLLQQSLGLAQASYGHLPLLVEAGGAKLAKSRHSTALEPALASHQLLATLRWLRQAPPPDLAGAPLAQIWGWALRHWQPKAIAGVAKILVEDTAEPAV